MNQIGSIVQRLAGKIGEMSAKVKSRLWRWLRVAVSIALLATLSLYVDFSQSLEIARRARLDLLFLAFVLSLADRFLAAYRWYILVHGKNPQITFRRVVHLIYVSGFLGFFVPGTVGVEVVRIYGLSRTTSDLALSFSSALVERILAFLALLLLVLLGLILFPTGLPLTIGYAAWLGLALLALVVTTLMHPRFRRLTDTLLPRTVRVSIGSRLVKFYAYLDAYKEQPVLMAWAMVLAFGFQLLRVTRIVIVAWALGLHFPIVHFVVIMPIIIFVTQIPISISGFGVREVSFVYLFGLVGMSPQAALSLSLLSFTISIIVATLPGACLYALVRGKPRRTPELGPISDINTPRSSGKAGVTRHATEGPVSITHGTPRNPTERNTVRTDHSVDAGEWG